MICMSLGGLCETKHQIQRLALPTVSSIFDWNITPTTSLVNIFAQKIPSDLFIYDNLVECSPWGNESRQIQDKRYLIRNVHDFKLDVPIQACYDEFRSKVDHQIQNTRNAIRNEDLVVFFHKVTQESFQKPATPSTISSLVFYLHRMRKGKPYHVVILDKFDLKPIRSEVVSWHKEIPPKVYEWKGNNDLWQGIVDNLKKKDLL